jgi:2-keto-4-pentenoate hydratase/2-oxohepta-3-ene-1,7-dioic acid hydratase in catechol pathway
VTQAIETFQLDNGLTVVVEPMAHARSVAWTLLLQAGSATDPDGLSGAANVLNGMVYRGAGERDARALSDALDSLGVQRGGGASTEYSTFGGAALADDIDFASLPMVADSISLPDTTLLPPVRAPEKIIAIGLNYIDHAREAGVDPPKAPVAFAKLPNSLLGHQGMIAYDAGVSQQVDYEAEMAVIIGRAARHVNVETALEYVFGYTGCNDVSARDAQFADGQWVRAKSFDTFCPLGPWIVTAEEVGDPQRLAVRCRLNGETMQNGTTADMIFSVAEIISYLSRFMTLSPGDVIATGTPMGVGLAKSPAVFLEDGDVVEVEVERVGTLRNTVCVTSRP